MRKATLILLFTALAVAQTDYPANLGPARVMSGSGTLKSGITVAFATYAIPGGNWGAAYGGGGIGVGTEKIHRSVIEAGSGTYFGYDLSFTGDAMRGYYAVFQQLSNAPQGSRMIVPKFPPPQPVHDGDTLALDLMVSPDGTRRIVDYIRISLVPPEPAPPATTSAPRDFTLDDGPVTYAASPSTIWIDGRKAGTLGFTGKPGATFWMSLPGRGRYVLSLVPHAGSVKAGLVRDNALSFKDGGSEFEVRFMSPIAGAGKAWNLYLVHDAATPPQAQSGDMIRSGVDRWDNLVSQK